MIQGSARNGRRSSWGQRVGLISLGFVLIGAILVYSTWFFGKVQGQEFSPDTFQRRDFAYYELPLLGIQVSPISRSDTTGELEEYLVRKKIVPTQQPAQPRWDLIEARRGTVRAGFGEAQILSNYLDATDADDHVLWLEWTEKHPDLAKVLWPIVANLARQELYVLVPDLLVLAKTATDPDGLAAQMDDHLAGNLLVLAESQQQLGRHEAAVELFTETLRHAPKQVEALRGRAQSLASLGKQEKAAADLAQAQELGKRF